MFCEVFETEAKGKGLRATKDLSIGDKVFDEAPALCVICNKIRKRFCSNCFELNEEKLLWCSGCRYLRYCGQTCQKQAWKRHRNECKRYPVAAPKEPSDLVRIMYRILDMKATNQDMAWYDNMLSNKEKLPGKRREEFTVIISVLAHFAGKELFSKFSSSEIFEIFAKICCNSFSICNGEMNAVGIGFYDTASKLNHSCNPNCVAVFDGPKIVIRAIKKIKAGQELTISYTEILRPTQIRQHELRHQYFFECSCEKCKNIEEDDLIYSFLCPNKDCESRITVKGICDKCGTKTDPETLKDWAHQAHVANTKIIELGEDKTRMDEALALCEKAVKEQEELLHPCHYMFLETLNRTLDGFMMVQNWEKALKYGLRTLEPYQRLYHPYHPNVGIQIYKIGKIQLLLDMYEQGFQTLDRALEILRVTHGDQHPTVLELKQIVAEVSEEYRQKRMQSSGQM